MPDQSWNDGYYGNAQGRGSLHYYGKGVFSSEYQRWNTGKQQRAADDAAAKSSAIDSGFSSISSPSSSFSTTFLGSTGGRSLGGSVGRWSYYSIVDLLFLGIRKTLWITFIIAMLYGGYNNLYDQTPIVTSGVSAAGIVFGLSDELGTKLRQTWPNSSVTPVINGVRVVATWGLAIWSGVGAATGNGVVWLGKDVLGFLATLGNDSR